MSGNRPQILHALFASLCVLAESWREWRASIGEDWQQLFASLAVVTRLACASHQASKIRILATLGRSRACILSYWG